MFNFLKKRKDNQNDVKNSAVNENVQIISDDIYVKMLDEFSAENLKILVDNNEEPRTIPVKELQRMLDVCRDVEKRGIILYAIATCYYEGIRGAFKSNEEGKKYDQKSMDSQNKYAMLRYGVNMVRDTSEKLEKNDGDEQELIVEHTLGVGYIVKSYRRGNERAKEVLKLLMDGQSNFYGARTTPYIYVKNKEQS